MIALAGLAWSRAGLCPEAPAPGSSLHAPWAGGLCFYFHTGPGGCPVGRSSLQLSHSRPSKVRAGLGLVLFSVHLSSRKFKAGPA